MICVVLPSGETIALIAELGFIADLDPLAPAMIGALQMSSENRVRRKRMFWLIAALGLILLIGSPVGYVTWLLSAHHYDPGSVSSRADVTYYTSVPPPQEAHEIRVAAFQFGQARLTFVRFLAPVDVCQKYAVAVMPNAALQPLSSDQEYSDLEAIYAGAEELHDLRWFDLPYANGLWTIQSGQALFPKPSAQIPNVAGILGADANTEQKGYLTTAVRVDVSRGVFYFLQEN